MGLIYFFCLPAFESPGIFCCDAPFIVPNPDLAFARLVIEFHQRSRLLSGLLDLFVIKLLVTVRGQAILKGGLDSHPALRRRAVHSVLKWAKVAVLAFFPRIIFHIL